MAKHVYHEAGVKVTSADAGGYKLCISPLFVSVIMSPLFQLTNIDVVRFPCGVLITEVRVIPPGIKAHSNLPDSRAFG